LGALFFIYIFGTAILDFTYTDWIMRSFWDFSGEHLGGRIFRNSAWHFPFGLMDNYNYPNKESILYNDILPLLATVFKLLSPLLPENFQFFGFFEIVCYILQGGIGALIVRKIGGNTVQSIIGSLFFTLSTALMLRIHFHISLSAHFIILLCILAYLENNNFSLKKQILVWGGLLALSVTVHPYFLPMVMIIMFFRLIREYTITKNFKNQCIVFGASVLVLAGTMFCFGAFYSEKASGGSGGYSVTEFSIGWLRKASANLNTFINPQQFVLNVRDMPQVLEGVSRFIRDMPVATEGQYEGYAYLGLGIILLAVVIVFQYIQDGGSDLKAFKKQQVLPVIGIVLSFLIFSLSPTVTLNQYKLFSYPLIGPIERLWAAFRNTGRMAWPIVYIIITFCIWQAITLFSVKKSVLILSAFLLIQWADLKPWFVSKGENYKTKVTWQSELPSPVWNDLANKYKFICFMGNYQIFGNYKLTSLLDLIANHKMIKTNTQEAYLQEYGPKNDTIYVFFEDQNHAFKYKDTGIYLYMIDNVIIGIDSKLNLP